MGKIDIHAIHHIIEGLGIPLDSVHLQRDGKTVELNFLPRATDEQKATAQSIVDEWDQDKADADKAAGRKALPSADDIANATKVADVKVMAMALRAYIDGHR